ncbi:cell wall-binding repeat-containing protein [Herbiconiux sp. 11R-BC]|uniref:cell wall-binding repeat-containing protein n=1 Tax=Herbiconiux sp. 11R-BC TaxID=3111637 RepID=UPI003C0E822C
MNSRFLSLGGGAATAALALTVSLLAAAPAHAVAPVNPVCPPTTATKGIPIPPTFALDNYKPDVHVAITEGALPPGLVLTGDETTLVPFSYSGTPTASGITNFTVTATIEGRPTQLACTMAVFGSPAVSRIGGADRYAQADAVSRSANRRSSDVVYVASGEKFSDALSAGSVAGLRNAPLLLTPFAAMTEGTKAEITRLAPRHIIVVGGPASVSDDVYNGLIADFPDATVKRIGGADRYEVSRSLLTDGDFGVAQSEWLYIANGGNFPDALSASPTAVVSGGAVLLVDGQKPALNINEQRILSGLGVKHVRIAGGPNSVSAALEADIGRFAAVTRNGGADRFDVAVSINNEVFGTAGTLYIASGVTFPDALSAAPIAGSQMAPIYLARTDCVPDAVLQEINRTQPFKVVILGGTNTLTADVEHLKSC